LSAACRIPPFPKETACGDTRAVAISDNGLLAFINGCGAVYDATAIAAG
jgi:hypothetical protein